MAESLAHTKWLCKYHLVFTPKYRRKIIYHQLRSDIQGYIKNLCQYLPNTVSHRSWDI